VTVIGIRVVDGKPQGGIVRPSVDQDDRVTLVVSSDTADEVHVHGYDLSADVASGGTVGIPFAATIRGRFEVELEDSGVQLAEITVVPPRLRDGAGGESRPVREPRPTWIYVVFWLGVPLLSALFGNVWRVLSPGRGWDVLSFAGYKPNLAPFAPETAHVAGLAVAHNRAVTIFHTRRDALRSQYAMLALTVLYTVGGLWILSRS
jgi:hypothetical protein